MDTWFSWILCYFNRTSYWNISSWKASLLNFIVLILRCPIWKLPIMFWIFFWILNLNNWQMLSSCRVAVVVLYSYKDDYYKILLWKPRGCTGLGEIPVCLRLRRLPETIAVLRYKESAWRLADSYLFHLESQGLEDKWFFFFFFFLSNGNSAIWLQIHNFPKTFQCFVIFLFLRQRWTIGSLNFIALIEL